MAAEAQNILQQFLANFRPSSQPADNPWSQAARLNRVNRDYISAANLFEQGKPEEALRALEVILKALPNYPFAVALRNIISQS